MPDRRGTQRQLGSPHATLKLWENDASEDAARQPLPPPELKLPVLEELRDDHVRLNIR